MDEGTPTVLVTGHAGLIGSHLADLLTENYRVVGVDNLSIGRQENINPDVISYTVDCQDYGAMNSVMLQEQPEIVFHCAAHAHEGLSQFSPYSVTSHNYLAHIATLTAAISNRVKKFIFLSSMSVYGDQEPPFDEDLPTKPEDIYAVSKASAEKSLQILAEVHDIDYTIIRPHNLYGERQIMDDPYRNVAAIFINQCLRDKPFYIYGDGEQKRAFTYVTDAIPAIAKAMHTASKEIINVGPTEEFTINQLAEEVLKHFPHNPEPIYLPPRPLEVKNAWCTNDKAKKLLDYETQTSFQDGVAKMVKWATTQGYQPPKYRTLELEGDNLPQTWKEKLL